MSQSLICQNNTAFAPNLYIDSVFFIYHCTYVRRVMTRENGYKATNIWNIVHKYRCHLVGKSNIKHNYIRLFDLIQITNHMKHQKRELKCTSRGRVHIQVNFSCF